ncbi:hypothetical protein H8L32_01205 [Undibacterium sp. CY18W]|uniref:Uncharacterized protein n=1 Tax=Undibacterium hunanense TaxID=2762292 RepID=A0ABR6ZJJ8_9BURK|nr:hypothetical protein [Undibacterium hunanense]MBC3916090.1 hypothetical protein [Undibacterium hunanense]
MLRNIIVVFTIFLITSMPAKAAPGYVIIDVSKPDVTSYTSIPKSRTDADLDKLRGQVSAQAGVSMETWEAFKNNLHLLVEAKIKKNEYPELIIKEGLADFLEKFEGIPLGLTWNGGIALTYNDYIHAKRTYQQYLGKPDSVARVSERNRDPVHPANHLKVLGLNKSK